MGPIYTLCHSVNVDEVDVEMKWFYLEVVGTPQDYML